MKKSKLKFILCVGLVCGLSLSLLLAGCKPPPEPTPKDLWTVVLDYNDNISRNGKLYVEKTKSVFLPDDAARKGYSFVCWQTESGESVPLNYMPVSDVKLVAEWAIGGCTVTFDVNYDGGTPITQTVEYGKTVTGSPVPPERKGYAFRYWSVNPGGEEVDFDNYPIEGDYTFYAIWRDSGIPELTVTFIVGAYAGAPAATSRTILQGGTIRASDAPQRLTRRGYKLEGWTAEEPAGDDWTVDVYPATDHLPALIKFAYTPLESCTLYAVWSIEQYIAIFNINYTDSSYAFGIYYNYTLLSNEFVACPVTDPSRENYTFDGWYTSARGGEKMDFSAGITLGANAGYYAHWVHNGIQTDIFHAEYVAFDPNKEYWGYSGSVRGAKCIVEDKNTMNTVIDQYPLNSLLISHKGYYVSYQYEVGCVLRFEITASKATTATLIGSLAIEDDKITGIGPSGEFSNLIKVNGNSLDYSPLTLRKTFTEYNLGNVQLKEGVNVIEFIVNNSSGAMGGTYKAVGFMTDYIKLANYGDTTLKWSPVYDNLEVLT